jgi:hypothetical protein
MIGSFSTSRDRRLESMILAGLVESMNRAGDAEDPQLSARLRHSWFDQCSDEELILYRQGMRIARFLVQEYGASTGEQWGFFAELAAEIAQRVADELPPAE